VSRCEQQKMASETAVSSSSLHSRLCDAANENERAINKLGDKLAARLIAGLSEENRDYGRLEPN